MLRRSKVSVAARCAAALAALPLVAAAIFPTAATAVPSPQGVDGEASTKVALADNDRRDRRLTLRQAAPRDLRIGTAVAGGGHHEMMPYPDPFPNDRPYRRILAAEFNSLSPENQMKWEFIHPERGSYRFGPADDIVAFARPWSYAAVAQPEPGLARAGRLHPGAAANHPSRSHSHGGVSVPRADPPVGCRQ